jgi:hypothetical protein
MKLRDYTIAQPLHHAYLDSGQNHFEVGTRDIESIEATPVGVVVTMLRGAESRAVLLTGQGIGAVQPEEEAKRWAKEFKDKKAQRSAMAASMPAQGEELAVP